MYNYIHANTCTHTHAKFWLDIISVSLFKGGDPRGWQTICRTQTQLFKGEKTRGDGRPFVGLKPNQTSLDEVVNHVKAIIDARMCIVYAWGNPGYGPLTLVSWKVVNCAIHPS